MKTVCKKLLCLMLVAMMLVSAIPMAHADTMYNFWIELYVDETHVDSKAVSVPAGIEMDEAAVKAYAQEHLYGAYFGEGYIYNRVEETKVADADNLGAKIFFDTVVAAPECQHTETETNETAATCTEDGEKIVVCASCGETISTETLPALGHDEVEEAATCEDDGEITCTRCDYSEVLPATGHDFVDGYCDICGEPDPDYEEPTEAEPEDEETTIYFHNKYADPDKTYKRTFENGETVDDLPAGVNVKGHDFKGWYSKEGGKGEKLENGDKWYEGMPETYYAYYIESVDDDVSTLSVYVRFYVSGVAKSTKLLYKQEFEDGDNMFQWLTKHETTTANAIFALNGADGYEWNPRYYYDYSGSEPLTEQDLIADGNKSIVVKVYSKDATEANVMLYVHKSKTSTVSAIYEMPGYTKGNNVTFAAVKEVVKKHYTGSNMTITGLYDDEAWAQLLNGENPTAANGIKVEHNGTTKIHIILKNATASDNSDTTNPKTGDYITIAATTMVLAAAALVSIIELKKRKMI